jgi:hypothetical protein
MLGRANWGSSKGNQRSRPHGGYVGCEMQKSLRAFVRKPAIFHLVNGASFTLLPFPLSELLLFEANLSLGVCSWLRKNKRR